MEKAEQVKIIQAFRVTIGSELFGLGSDSKIYYWSVEEAVWYLYKKEK